MGSETNERKIADDYRRQLQEAFAKDKSSFWPKYLQSIPIHRERLTAIATRSLGPGAFDPAFVDRLMATLEKISLTSPHDEPFTQSIMQMLCEDIENACREIGIQVQGAISYGSSPSMDVDAAQYSVYFTDASVINLSLGFITFCSHASKLVSRSVLYEQLGQQMQVSFEPKSVLAKIDADPELQHYWSEVIGAYALGAGPFKIAFRFVQPPHATTRFQVLHALEHFAVAHEYAHHIGTHGRRSEASATADESRETEEYQADLFAFALSRYIGDIQKPPNVYEISGSGAVLLLKMLECVRLARQVFVTGNDELPPPTGHPSTRDRVAAFDAFDEQIDVANKMPFLEMRHAFATIIESVWATLLRPTYVEMHKRGVRPQTSNDDWLPR